MKFFKIGNRGTATAVILLHGLNEHGSRVLLIADTQATLNPYIVTVNTEYKKSLNINTEIVNSLEWGHGHYFEHLIDAINKFYEITENMPFEIMPQHVSNATACKQR